MDTSSFSSSWPPIPIQTENSIVLVVRVLFMKGSLHYAHDCEDQKVRKRLEKLMPGEQYREPTQVPVE